MVDLIFKNVVCPVCKGAVKKSFTSVFCKKRHSFDIAKSGYFNLLARSVKNQYDKEQFAARRLIYENGFYAPMVDKIAALVPNVPELWVLDAGCGEGHHLSELRQRLLERSLCPLCAGIDITKDAITIAAKSDSDILWCVADLSAIPFADKSFSVILDILSPANYAEFARLLKPQGRLIKLIPGDNYLIELRRHLFGGQSYSPKRVADYFGSHFEVIGEELLAYSLPLPKELAGAIVKMTPMSWNAPPEKIAAFIENPPPAITFEFVLITGKAFSKAKSSAPKNKKPQKKA